MNKKLVLTPLSYFMGFELSPLHYKTGHNDCILRIPDFCFSDFAKKMRTAEGAELYNWLFVAREQSMEHPEKYRTKCPWVACICCGRFKNYRDRLTKNKPLQTFEPEIVEP